MKIRVWGLVMAMAVLFAAAVLAQDGELPLKNWTAPPYWTPPRAAAEAAPEERMEASAEGMTASAQALPSSPVPFVAIAPCRIVDTRVPTSDGFHEPNFADGETRTFAFPASPDCPGLPATSVAYSLNVQYRPLSVLAFITLFPTGTTMPTVSTLTAGPAAWVEDAAIIPAGTSGAVDVYCQYAGRVVIDVNGYYAAQSLVSSLNAKTGDLTLAAGTNIGITPSGNTLTIAATGGPGGVLPTGTTGQTLYNSGSGWTASSALTNDDTNVGITGALGLPATTATTGQIKLGGDPFLHDYAGLGTDGQNTFVGQQAGNFTMGGADAFDGSYNVGVGYQALASETTGYGNTGTGDQSLYFNTTGQYNTANGLWSLYNNTTSAFNSAIGSYSLFLNTTGSYNTADGDDAGGTNTVGSYDTFVGAFGNPAVENLTNATAIGANSVVDASNHVRIGDILVTQIGGNVAWSNLSDARAKSDIRDLDLGLDFVLALRPVSFTLKTGDGRTDMGFLAQDVEAVLGDGYSVLGIGGDPDRTLSLRYTDLIAPMVKAIQEQQAQITDQAKTVQAQQTEIDAKNARIAALENRQTAQQGRIDGQQTQIALLTAKVAASDVLRTQLETVTARLAALEKVATATR